MWWLKAALLAMALSSPLYPMMYIVINDGLLQRAIPDAPIECWTDTECAELNGGDGYDD